MHPVAFEFGPLTIRWYGIMAALGFLAGSFVFNRYREHAKLDSDGATSVLLVALISGLVGARLFYVIQFFDHYRDNLLEIVRIDHGGLVFYGGLLAVPSLWIYSKIRKLDFVRICDVMALALVTAHIFGRIGCFLNGCCYGKTTGSIFGVVYPASGDPAFANGLARHPIQIYESIENVAVFFLLTAILRRDKRGCTVSAYFAVYGVLRFLNEFFRGDNELFFGTFTIAQLIGLLLVPSCTLLYIHFSHAGQKRS